MTVQDFTAIVGSLGVPAVLGAGIAVYDQLEERRENRRWEERE